MEKIIEVFDIVGMPITIIIVLYDHWKLKRERKTGKKTLSPFKNKTKLKLKILFMIIIGVLLIMFFLWLAAANKQEFSEFYFIFKFIMSLFWIIAVIYYLMGQFYPKLFNVFSTSEKEQ